MTTAESYKGDDRRARDRSAGILLRRRQNRRAEIAEERRRRANGGYDIAAALELHLDDVTTRRGMIALLQSWLHEAQRAEAAERDDGYVRALEHAILVMSKAPDPETGIAVLQRA
jgi:hypothetical protein